MNRAVEGVRNLFATPRVRWLPAGAVVLIAALLRFWDLARVPSFMFDERYYVPQALSLAKLGYEATWNEYISDAGTFNPADLAQVAGHPAFTTHGPVTKWILWLGMSMFGVENPVGWRIMPAVFGVVLVVLTMVVAYQLFRSAAWATFAGFLISVDGLAVLMSRTAMLDVFLATFTLAGVSAVLADRTWVKHGRGSWWRPWLLVAGIMFGLATGVKVVAVVFLVVFGIVVVVSGMLPLPEGSRDRWRAFFTGAAGAAYLLVSAVLGWLASWTSYFVSSAGPGRASEGFTSGVLGLLPQPVRALLGYQNFAYLMESRITGGNHNASPAASWPFMILPVQFKLIGAGDGVEHTTATPVVNVLSLGNPLIWWTGIIALFVVLFIALLRRNGSAWLILAGLAAGWGPWLLIGDRTIYQYYSIVFEPYLILAIVLAATVWYRKVEADPGRRNVFVSGVLVWSLLVLVLSVWLAPFTYGLTMSWSHWESLQWLPSWR